MIRIVPSHVVTAIMGLVLSFLNLPTAHTAISARDVMVKNEDARKVSEVQSSATLTIGGNGNPERVKQFNWWRKLSSDQTYYNTLNRFLTPAEVRGEGILFLERKEENEVSMYLPNFKKIRRVEGGQQSGSFMGSEFSYSDIAAPHVNDFEYKLLKEEGCPGKDNSAVKCYVIEMTPVSDSVKDRVGCTKQVSWIRQDNFMSVQNEYYDQEGVLFKRMEAFEINIVDASKRKWMAQYLKMKNLKNEKYTFLKFAQVKVNQGIPDSIFTQQHLQRGQ